MFPFAHHLMPPPRGPGTLLNVISQFCQLGKYSSSPMPMLRKVIFSLCLLATELQGAADASKKTTSLYKGYKYPRKLRYMQQVTHDGCGANVLDNTVHCNKVCCMHDQ